MAEKDVQDPISEHFWKTIRAQVKHNTEVYREIFGCDPDDTIKTAKDLLAVREKIAYRKPEEQLAKYEGLRTEIKGHAVEWPTEFFINEQLQLGWLQVEGLLPEKNFL